MKRKLCLCLLLLPFICFAKHVEFMGLPLNMSITQFTTKAAAKGIKYNKPISSTLDNGTRAFDGTFFGEEAYIFVYYNPKTKLVYRAKACVDFENQKYAEGFLSAVLAGLEKKYPDGWSESETQDGFPSFTYYFTQAEPIFIGEEPQYDIYGGVDGYITQNIFDVDTYTVHIDYVDLDNLQKNNDSKLNDL